MTNKCDRIETQEKNQMNTTTTRAYTMLLHVRFPKLLSHFLTAPFGQSYYIQNVFLVTILTHLPTHIVSCLRSSYGMDLFCVGRCRNTLPRNRNFRTSCRSIALPTVENERPRDHVCLLRRQRNPGKRLLCLTPVPSSRATGIRRHQCDPFIVIWRILEQRL